MSAFYLLDTNIVSEAGRKRPDAGVVRFLNEQANLRVSVILFYELMFGVEKAPKAEQARLRLFYEALEQKFAPRAFPVDLAAARKAGELRALAHRKGRVLADADALIAATAIAHGATLVTRNVKDFEGLDVRVLNPFGAR